MVFLRLETWSSQVMSSGLKSWEHATTIQFNKLCLYQPIRYKVICLLHIRWECHSLGYLLEVDLIGSRAISQKQKGNTFQFVLSLSWVLRIVPCHLSRHNSSKLDFYFIFTIFQSDLANFFRLSGLSAILTRHGPDKNVHVVLNYVEWVLTLKVAKGKAQSNTRGSINVLILALGWMTIVQSITVNLLMQSLRNIW